jgi:hypothetical protein
MLSSVNSAVVSMTPTHKVRKKMEAPGNLLASRFGVIPGFDTMSGKELTSPEATVMTRKP